MIVCLSIKISNVYLIHHFQRIRCILPTVLTKVAAKTSLDHTFYRHVITLISVNTLKNAKSVGYFYKNDDMGKVF